MMNFFQKVKLVSVCLASVIVINTVGPASYVNANEKETRLVEAFSVETSSETKNNEGFYEDTGHKYVNSITTVTETVDTIKTKMELVEDYYDVNGNYINTVVSIKDFENDYNTGKAMGADTKKILTTPATIEKKNEVKTNRLINENTIEQNVTILSSSIKENEMEETQGITRDQILEMQEMTAEIKSKYKIEVDRDAPAGQKIKFTEISPKFSPTAGGAFDTYYNFDLSTTKFRVQALSNVGHDYIRLDGKTLNSTKNANSLTKFISHVQKYETQIIANMKYDEVSLYFDWLFVIVGLVAIVVTWPTGPAGWAAIVMSYTGAFSTFRTLTATYYATNERMEMSRQVGVHLEDARAMLLTYGDKFENVTFDVVDGY